MLRIFSHELMNPKNFVITLELVPGRESFGENTDTLIGIAKDAFKDGRISAVSITDNPGGNPSLSPDILGYEIFRYGLDVIVHFSCRDMNRMGMESRALQLARLGLKNILAVTGDYSGKGFLGRGAPVFDLDSVLLSAMLKKLGEKLARWDDPEPFFTGCAISPFKNSEAECQAQYHKLDKKINAGASFMITQLGYNVKKFQELILYHKLNHPNVPLIASVYMLSRRSVRAMYKKRVPGAHIPAKLYNRVIAEWETPVQGLKASIERTARLGAILKGLGYRGIHIGGVHRNFKTVRAILDRMDELEGTWQEYVEEFEENSPDTYYLFDTNREYSKKQPLPERLKEMFTDHLPYKIFNAVHGMFFNKNARLAPFYKRLAIFLEKYNKVRVLKYWIENPLKILFLSCQSCGDCAIQHIAFQCPESGCPKHTRNGPCGGSLDRHCEVYPEKLCIWVRAYERLKHAHHLEKFMTDNVPPRMWELDRTSSWINFHLERDHQKNGANAR